jgi:hypothetical protein
MSLPNITALKKFLEDSIKDADQEIKHEQNISHNWQEMGEAVGKRAICEEILKEFFD